MTIRDYCDNILATEELEDACEYIETLFHCYEEDDEDFTLWALENGIDLDARDARTGELVVTLWAWDWCGE